MKHIFLKIGFITIFSAVFFSSCQKEEIEPVNIDDKIAYSSNDKSKHNKSKFLTGKQSKSWIIYTYLVNDVDYTSTVPVCNLDNVLTFYKKGKYIQTEGETKCDPTSLDTYDKGTWEFQEKGSKIYLNAIRFNTVVEVLDLSETELRVKFFDPSFNAFITFWLRPVDQNICKI